MIYLAAVLLFLPFMLLAAVPDDTRVIDKLQATAVNPVIIPGSRLGSIRGKDIPLVRVFSMHNERLEPIPFQVDQIDSRGDWVWDVVYVKRFADDYEDDHQEGIGNFKWRVEPHTGLLDDEDPDQQEIIDDNDVLVFMAKDMGRRAPDVIRQLNDASVILEIETAKDINGTRSWAYIAYFKADPPPYSTVRYVRYMPDTRRVVTPVYEVGFSKDYVAVLEHLKIGSLPVMDRTKVRGSVRLGRQSVGKTFHFNEQNIRGRVDGYINGPVRVVKRNLARLNFGILFSSPEINCDQYFYAHYSEIPVNLSFNIFIDQVSLLLAADYHNNPFRRAHIGGVKNPVQLSEISSSTNIFRDAKSVPWIALEGEAASVISVLTLPEEVESFAEVTPYLVNDSNLADPPEDYRGNEPKAGYAIKTKPGFPRGRHTLVGTYLYIPRPFIRNDAEQILGLVKNRPGYSISEYSPAAEVSRLKK